MTPGPPATEDVFGELATVRVIPVVVLDESAVTAPLADAGPPAPRSCCTRRLARRYGAGHGALAMTTPGDTSTTRGEEVDSLGAGADR